MTSIPPNTIPTELPSDGSSASGSPARRAIVAAAAALGFGWLGALFGQEAGYAIAHLARRDPAEVKDLLIWVIISSPFVMASLGAWLALLLTGAGRAARTVALSFLIVITAGALAIVSASYDWPRASGIPVYDYELRLPAGMKITDHHLVDLTIGDGKSGRGCAVTGLQHVNGRAQVNGSFVLDRDYLAPQMSMRLREGTVHPHPEGHWRLPVMTTTKVETEFSPWHKIEFIAAPRVVPSVPPGDYEIRYRLRRFI